VFTPFLLCFQPRHGRLGKGMAPRRGALDGPAKLNRKQRQMNATQRSTGVAPRPQSLRLPASLAAPGGAR